MPPDYVITTLAPLHQLLWSFLAHGEQPSFTAGLVFSVALVLQVGAIASAIALSLGRLRVLADAPASRALRAGAQAVHAVIAVAAGALLVWTLRHRSDSLTEAMARWDHWVLCALLGHLLSLVALRVRTSAVAVLSLVFVARYGGPEAVALVLLGSLAGWLAARAARSGPARVDAAVQTAILGSVVGGLWWLRPSNGLLAMQGWGLACWVLMRHVSFVVEARRGAPAALHDYLCYLWFFPSCIGATEVYDEFSARNLQRADPPDLRAGVVGGVRGQCLVTLALMIPMSQEQWLDATTFGPIWWRAVLWFGRGALFVMGTWSMLEADAALLGFRLRPNFTGVLTAENPSRFWRAWRGTMTNWLIRYVYIPLGGNRSRQTLNILAAFAVSTAWHMTGVPFLHPTDWRWRALVPTVAWGALNFAGVAVHAAWRRRWPAGTWIRADAWALRALKIAGTLCFASTTVTILGFPLDRLHELPRVLCTMAGLGPACRP
jgi:hypothetical protein